ncbi:MAG: leucine-rich repeat protein [Paludibacteraceae bacterium]|nr:leucine-rich repeat protein [Paludibacteraceae bacterium]
MKKLFTLFLALATSVGNIIASDTQVDGIWYNFDNDTQTAEVTFKGSSYSSYSDRYAGSVVVPLSVMYNNQNYSVTSIGNNAFRNCTGLTAIIIPNNIISIGDHAFSGCTGLTSITILDGVISIENNAFYGCSGLTSIEIPNSVTHVGTGAFLHCSGLTSPVYNAQVFAFMPTSYSGSYTIQDGIESIAGCAFRGCSDLTSIEIPNSITSIGTFAFDGCSGITSIDIPNGVTSIEDYVLKGCTGLTSVIIPNSVTSIGRSAFEGCSGLTSLTIPNNVTKIGCRAFNGCLGLTSMTIPNSVTSIGLCTFEGCTNLIDIYATCGDLDRIKQLLDNDSRVKYAPSPYTISTNQTSNGSISIPSYNGCDDSTQVTAIPNESYHFVQWENGSTSNPRTIYLTQDMTIEAIFAHNPIVTYVYDSKQGNVLGATTTPTGIAADSITFEAKSNRGFRFVRWADGNAENPRTIYLDKDTTMEALFDYQLTGKCGKDSVLTWKFDPSTMALDITGKGALSENYTYGTFIESVTIGNEITQLGTSAFNDFVQLKNVILGTSVKVLESKAFRYCSAIETITCYSQRPPTVNEYALYGVDYNTIVYVPADYLENYKMHDVWGLYDVRPIGAKSTETTEITITPSDNTADIIWPTIEGAYTYELVIKDKDGNVICTLTFNANGQLTSIAFNAPARGDAPQKAQTTGFAFTVTGLNSGTGYDLILTSKDSNGSTLDTQTVSFTTTGEPQGFDQITNGQSSTTTKILRNGQILILRGEKTYTLTGQEVK